MHMEGGGSKSVFLIFSSDDTFRFYQGRLYYSDDPATKDPSPSSDVGTWVHWAGTFEATTKAMTVYRGGVKQELWSGGAASAASAVSAPVTWGARSFPDLNGLHGRAAHLRNSDPFTGSMDELRTYVGTALTADQLATVMSSTSTSQGGLISSLNFDTSNLLLDAACGSSSNATSSGNFTATTWRNYGVTATTGKVCGAVSSAGSVCA